MKKTRLIALFLAILTVVCIFASCTAKIDENTTSSSTEEQVQPKEPPKQFNVVDMVFDGKTDEVDSRFEANFDVEDGGNISLDGEALTVVGSGAYAINDKELTLSNEDYEYITIEFDLKSQSLPTAGTPSIVSPLYYLDSLVGFEEEGGSVNETGVVYQFFFKVDTNGRIAYYNKNWIGGYYKDASDNEVKLEANKTYKFKIEYDNLGGSYDLYMNGTKLKGGGNIVTVFEEGNTNKFVLRFFDGNTKVNFNAKIDNLVITAIPYKD